jgi:hypothetical protein
MNQSKQFVTAGQTSGQGSYSAPNAYKQNGPIVAGNERYDNYGGNGNNYQYQQQEKKESGCCVKMCACLGATICCCCVLDCLT